MQRLLLVILSLLIATGYSKLRVVSPSDVKNKIATDSQGIPFQLVRSGRIPYGSNIIGTLVLADPENGCSTIDSGFKSDKRVQVPIIVAKRGDCTLKAKARYAQLAGAKMLIVIHDQDEIPRTPIGVDQDPDISIPTILIAKKEGEQLYNEIKPRVSENNETIKNYVVVSMTFPYGPVGKSVELDFWFSSSDTTSNAYRFLREFKDFYVKSEDSFNFHPHYITLTCTSCQESGYKTAREDCLSGGRYCAHDPDSDGPLDGSTVVMENLRQMCIWTKAEDKWWDYVDRFGNECVNKEDQEDCVSRIMKDILSSNEMKAVQSCIDSSFVEKSGDTNNERISDNRLLRDQRLIQEEHDISMSPSLFINHQIYRGHYDATTVLKAACESLSTASSVCEAFGSERVPAKLDFGTILIFIGVMLVFVIVILYFYRRMTRREMTKEMSIQVSQMVSQYFALNEGKRRDDF